MLSFFYASVKDCYGYDPEDFGAWKVMWSSPGSLERRPTPAGLLRDNGSGPYSSCRVDYWPGHSAPCWESFQLDPFELTYRDYEAFFDAWTQFALGPQAHQLLGWAFTIQGPMEDDCQRSIPSTKGLNAWRILFQIRADEQADMEWGDVGYLYFWIRQEDLERQDFSKAWMISQCH